MPKDKGEKKKRKQESSDSDSGPDMENLPDEWLLDEVRDDPNSVHDIKVLTDSDSEEEVRPIVECILPEEDELPISPTVNPPEDPTPKVPALLLQDYPSRSQHDETPPQNPRNPRQKSYEQSKALRQQVEYESDFSADEFDSFSSGSGDDFEPDIDDLETRDREVIPDGFLSMFKPLLSDDDSPPPRPNSPLTHEFPPPKRQKKKVTKKKINPTQEPTAPRPAAPQSVTPRSAAPLPYDADHDPLVELPIKQKFGLPTPRRPRPPPAEQPAEPLPWEGGPPRSEIPQGPPWIRVFPPEPPMDDRDVQDSKKLKLDKDDIDSFHIEGMKYLKVRTFRGKVLIDIREYYDAGGEVRPGKKGISLSAAQWKKVISLSDQVEGALKKV